MSAQRYDPSILSLNIYRFRNSKGFTVEKFSEQLDVTPRQVYNWESGKNTPKLKRLIEIAMALSVTLDSLLTPE